MEAPAIAIVGSADAKRTDYNPPLRNMNVVKRAMEELGAELAKAGYRILVYSPSPDYIKGDIVRGYLNSKAARDKSIVIRYPLGASEESRFPEQDRWGTPAENQWTADLARNLKGRGYPVIFDRDEPQESVNVPEIVSKIADCRYFLAILDAGYIERIGRPGSDKILDGWVYDEYNTAASLSNHGQLRIVGLLRSGSDLPNSFEHPVPGMRGNTIDVRSPEQLALVLDDLFPPIENGPGEAEVERARVHLRESYEQLCARRFQEAFRSAQALTELLPGVIDGPAQKVRIAFQAGWVAEGLAAAEEALALAPRSRELLLAAGSFANAAGEPVRAVAHFGLFLELYGQSVEPDVAAAHLGLGSGLDDLDQLYPAIAHLELARRRQPTSADIAGTLGYVYLRAGEATTAIERLEEGLTHDPENVTVLLNLALALCYGGRTADARDKLEKLASVAPDHPQLPQLRALVASPQKMPLAVPSIRARCAACSARVPVTEDDDVLCGRCGSIRSKDQHACPYCGSDGRVFLIPGIPFGCPYCREGTLSVE